MKKQTRRKEQDAETVGSGWSISNLLTSSNHIPLIWFVFVFLDAISFHNYLKKFFSFWMTMIDGRGIHNLGKQCAFAWRGKNIVLEKSKTHGSKLNHMGFSSIPTVCEMEITHGREQKPIWLLVRPILIEKSFSQHFSIRVPSRFLLHSNCNVLILSLVLPTISYYFHNIILTQLFSHTDCLSSHIFLHWMVSFLNEGI